MKTPSNITTIRQSLGTGQVREERKPATAAGKKRGVAGNREAEARRQREEAQTQDILHDDSERPLRR